VPFTLLFVFSTPLSEPSHCVQIPPFDAQLADV
jgi:hypothetical protein